MKTEYNSKLIYVIAVVAATGGLLFGFDTGVISGAIPFFQKDFGIDNGMIRIVWCHFGSALLRKSDGYSRA